MKFKLHDILVCQKAYVTVYPFKEALTYPDSIAGTITFPGAQGVVKHFALTMQLLILFIEPSEPFVLIDGVQSYPFCKVLSESGKIGWIHAQDWLQIEKVW